MDLENNPNITDAGENIFNPHSNPEGVDHLKKLSKLEELYLGTCDITAKMVLELLQTCKGIKNIAVSECPSITDTDIEQLEDLYPDVEIDY